MERLALRPEFDGDVQSGKRYVLVDDVTSLGGTLAELGHYIQSKGGIVEGIFVLVNAGRSKSFSPDKQTLKILEERYSNELIEIFGIKASALTANEARCLVGFRSVDEIRNRLTKAKKEVELSSFRHAGKLCHSLPQSAQYTVSDECRESRG
jgi:orotate phosphoribosyltransferase